MFVFVNQRGVASLGLRIKGRGPARVFCVFSRYGCKRSYAPWNVRIEDWYEQVLAGEFFYQRKTSDYAMTFNGGGRTFEVGGEGGVPKEGGRIMKIWVCDWRGSGVG